MVSCLNGVENVLMELSGLYIDYYPVTIERTIQSAHRPDSWECSYCHAQNYHWRLNCFKCLVPRSTTRTIGGVENDTAVVAGEQDISKAPTKFLLLRALTLDSSAKSIYEELMKSCTNLLRVWLVCDKQLRISRGFAFLEFESVSEAEEALSSLLKTFLDSCRGQKADISFGRDLHVLNSLFLKGSNAGELGHWDPLLSLHPYPEVEVIVQPDDESTPKIFSRENPPLQPPTKKIKMNFKLWDHRPDAIIPSKDEIEARIEHFIDPFLLSCLLCQVNFESQKDLKAHENDDVHNTKVLAYRSLARAEEQRFIDRAAERRELVGIDTLERAEEPLPVTTTESFGSKILEKLGWVKGKGLGPQGAGIAQPIMAVRSSVTGAGLGAASLEVAGSVAKSKSYKEMTRQSVINSSMYQLI